MISKNNFNFTVVICVLNNSEGLKYCIESILLNSILPEEIIVVHAGDSDNVLSYIELLCRDKWLARIKFKYIKSVKSLVVQRNIGIEESTGDVIFFIDDDAYLENDFFKIIMDFYNLHWSENIGGVQGTIAEHKSLRNSPAILLKKLLLLSHLNGKGKMQKSGYPSFLHYSPFPKKVEIFNGCQMSFKREILLEEKFDIFFKDRWFGDDYELSYRISQQFSLFQLPNAIIHHTVSSQDKDGLRKIWRMQIVNHDYIFKKYFASKKHNIILYYFSFFGDILTVLSQSFRHRSLLPIFGCIEGIKTLFAK